MDLAAGLHEVLARLMYEKGKVSPRDVDVRFDPPRRDWVGALTRPTIDFYLFDVRENTELRHSDLQANRTPGMTTYKLPPRRFDLRYMVSALTTRVQDEHILLWRTLAVLLKHSSLPREILPDSFVVADPPISTQVQQRDEEQLFMDLWSGFEVHPRPTLLYTVTAPIDLDVTIEAPLVLTRTARYRNVMSPDLPMDTMTHIGGTLTNADGTPIENAKIQIEGRASAPVRTDAKGRFVLVGVPDGQLALRVSRNGEPGKPMTLTVPSDQYELVLQ
jgi:hypothetical protein